MTVAAVGAAVGSAVGSAVGAAGRDPPDSLVDRFDHSRLTRFESEYNQ